MKTVDGALAFAEGVYSRVSDAGIIAAEVRRLREENERLRVQLAGCGVAAMQNTADSREHRIEKGAYGWSASYADVCSAVDREIALREENERLLKDAERLDWVGRQYLQDFCMVLVVDADHDGEYYVEGDDNQKGYGLTLRDAIDAARGAK